MTSTPELHANTIENKTFDEIQLGDSARVVRALDQNDVET